MVKSSNVDIIDNDKNNKLILCHDDTFEGMLTAVFESYTQSKVPISITGQEYQRIIGVTYKNIETNFDKVMRVLNGIKNKMGTNNYNEIWIAFLSYDIYKSEIIYKYIRLGMNIGYKVSQHLTNSAVINFNALVHKVNRECMQQKEFMRFSCIKGEKTKIYYAKMTPKNDVLTAVMPFFASRFNIQPFIIHDTRREIAGVFDTKEWFVTSAKSINIPQCSSDELEYKKLWKKFYESVTIKERKNHKLRSQHMPKKFWHSITEMNMLDTDLNIKLPSEISRKAVQQKEIENKKTKEIKQKQPTIR